MLSLLQDFKFGARMLFKHPGFTLIAVITLALGIGANTAIFSVINAVLIKPLPYQAPERLVTLRSNESVPDLTDIKAWTQSFEEIGGITFQPLDFTGGSEPEQWLTGLITGGYFNALGVRPVLGRWIGHEDDKPGGARVVVLSHELWRAQLNSDPEIVGKNVPLSGNSYTVIGVMPDGFKSPREDVIAWVPIHVASPDAAAYRGVHFLRSYLRLKPGATIEQAMSELGVIDRRLAEAYPEEAKTRRSVLITLKDRIVGSSRDSLLILFAAVGVVLLIACANFANLLLARGAAREQELVIRAALGASRWRLIRQWMVESVLIALLGGTLGILLAKWGMDLLIAFKPENYVRLDRVEIDGAVLLFTLGVSILTGLVFGLIPAWNISGVDPGQTLKDGGRSGVSLNRRRLRSALIVVETALALVLLVCAGLLIRSFQRLTQVNPGFEPDNLLTSRIELPEARYKDIPTQLRFRRALLDEINSQPGVSAALISELPLGSDHLTHNFQVEGQAPVAVGEEPEVDTRSIAGDYFQVMQIPLLAGRALDSQDRPPDGIDAPLVGVVNETLKRQFFPNENPIGRRVRWARDDEPRWIAIVGVVADVNQFGLDQTDQPALYTPYDQSNRAWKRWMNVVARGRDSAVLAGAVKSSAWKLDRQLPVKKVRAMSEIVAESVGERRFNMGLLEVFAALALVLALVGIYGVMSFVVTQRRHEIGLRMALGAQKGDVMKLVVGQGMSLVVMGAALGIAASFAVTRLLSTLLFGVGATDPVTFLIAASLLILVALLACWIPAKRATDVDPMIALRYE